MLYSEFLQISENLNSLAYFIGKSLKEESHSLKVSDLKTKTDNLLQLVRGNESKIRAIDSLLAPIESYNEGEYLAGSRISAISKGHEVLRRLKERNYDLSNYGYISLGGGDGTELYTVIENSKINFGVLLEYDFESAKRFLSNYIPFKLRNYSRWNDISLDVVECDLFDKNKLAVTKKLIQSKQLKGIVVSIHAVLHELSTRSQLKSQFLNKTTGEIILEEFFREIFEWHENIIIVIREPGIAENWNDDINIAIGEEHKLEFLKMLEELDNSHFEGTSGAHFQYRESQNLIRCNAQLAIEALTKLFYREDYQYEKRERVTSVSREKIIKGLQAGNELYKIEQTEAFFTGSVQANMNKFGVKVTAEGNYPLPNPQCFTYTIATSGIHTKTE